ncbi:MAG: hypothetical protein KHY82_12060, partial [Subdoligranulum sp.]|nr:hypothetical protein [Subdoligranulum sp.]
NTQNRSKCGFVEAAARRRVIIASNPPLARLRVCPAHADAPVRMGLRTLKHAKPQQVWFC